MTEPTDIGKRLAVTSRRQFLHEGGALLGGAAIAGGLAGSEASAATDSSENLPPNVPEWMKTPGDPMGSQLYGTPSPFEKDVVKNIPKNLSQYLSASGRTPCRISTASSRRTDYFMNAIMAASPPSIRPSTG
jgi:sulfane dehydrogenase subunit SoxC